MRDNGGKERFGVLSEENTGVAADADKLSGDLSRQQSAFDTSTVQRMPA